MEIETVKRVCVCGWVGVDLIHFSYFATIKMTGEMKSITCVDDETENFIPQDFDSETS